MNDVSHRAKPRDVRAHGVGPEVPPARNLAKHPLDEPPEASKHKFALMLPAICLLVLAIATLSPCDGTRDILAPLLRNRQLEMFLGIIGIILMTVDVVGPARMRALDRAFFAAFAGQSTKVFLCGAIRRIGAYFRAYIGPGFLYERDLLLSWGTLLALVDCFHVRDSFSLLVMGTTAPTWKDALWSAFILLWAGMGFHTLCRLPRRLAKPRRIHWAVGQVGFALMIVTMVPWVFVRVTIYLWCYVLYAPLDLIAVVCERLHLEGSLKILGATLALAALILAYLRG